MDQRQSDTPEVLRFAARQMRHDESDPIDTVGHELALHLFSREGTGSTQQPLIQVTHRLTLSPTAAIELINGLNVTLTAFRQAQTQAQQAGHA
jgi:hypothetical protein